MPGGVDKRPRDGDPAPPALRAERQDDKGASCTKRIGVRTAVFTAVQGAAWVALSLAAVLVYLDVLPLPEAVTAPPVDIAQWEFAALLANVYFRESTLLPDVPLDLGGMTSPRIMFFLMAVMLAVNVVWFFSSAVMLATVRGSSSRRTRPWILLWATATSFVTAVDVMLAAAVSRDLALLARWDDTYSDDLRMCTGLVLVVAVRIGFLLLANVYCMFKLLRSLAKRGDDPSSASQFQDAATILDREGPIDAFLYRNGDRDTLGAYNPVFVPDEGAAPAQKWHWASFKPQGQDPHPQEQMGLDRYSSKGPPGRRLRRIDVDDVSHLSWMEEANKHVELRSASRPSVPPPPQHRYGWHGPTRSPTLPPLPGEPLAQPLTKPLSQLGAGPILPRLRVDSGAPYPPIPKPDYSPPVQRATGKTPQRMLGRYQEYP